MQRYPVESTLLSSLIGQPYPNLPVASLTGSSFDQQSTKVSGLNAPVFQSSGMLDNTVIGREMECSARLHQASEKFACYQTEASWINAKCL